MAGTCPDCHAPEAIAYVENDSGIHPFPCLECTASTIRAQPGSTLMGSAPCATRHCQGSVQDEYVYNQRGRLIRITKKACQFCRSIEAKEPGNARGAREYLLPDPRL
ncbi:hypothetical protein P3T26_002530 [Streptomyces sp. MAA16]|nr:hypothetical protein [Streptomyces sp. MAA16]